MALDELESVGDVTATLLGVGASDEAENDLELGDGWDEDDEELDELR